MSVEEWMPYDDGAFDYDDDVLELDSPASMPELQSTSSDHADDNDFDLPF